jgi:hypothetical protein
VPSLPTDPRTRLWWVVGTIGILLGVALATWYALAREGEAITPQVTSYRVVDDATTVVDFDVRRPEGATVVCTVTALDERFPVVGSQDLRVEAPGDRTVHRQVTLRTTHRAVSGTVKECRRAS